jgi:hypothetical protein
MFNIKRCFESAVSPLYYEVFDLDIWAMDEEHKNNFQKADKIKTVADKMHKLQMSFLKEAL